MTVNKGLLSLVENTPNFSNQALENAVNTLKIGWVIKSFQLDTAISDNNVLSLSQKNDLKDLINTGTGAIDGILAVASEGESPRAYEVAAQMIKVVSEANKDLVDLHKRMGDIKKDKTTNNVKNTTNNSIYVGSTKELLDMINDSRSTTKFIDHE